MKNEAFPEGEQLTLADYFAWLDRNPDARGELLDGVIVMMTGGTLRHNRIAGNIFAALRGPARARGCEVFIADVIIRRSDVETFGAAPDVFVRCGQDAAPDDRTVCDPTVIFEVLSPSTEQRDRTQKFLNYQAITSLHTYVLVRQDEPRVEAWHRDGGILRPRTPVSGLEGDLAIGPLDYNLPLTAVYEGVDWAV